MAGSETVQTLARGLHLLQTVANAEEPLSLQSVCVAAGVKATTAHNLLRTLCVGGWLEKIGAPPKYRLGPAALLLSRRELQRRLIQRAHAEMLALARRFPGLRVSWGEVIGSDVVVTWRVTPELPERVQHTEQTVMLPFTSAHALLFQALWMSEQRRAYHARYPFYEYGHATWETPEAFDAALQTIRERGYANLALKDGAVRLAAPVFDTHQRLAASFGTYIEPALVRSAPFSADELLAETLRVANALSQPAPATLEVKT